MSGSHRSKRLTVVEAFLVIAAILCLAVVIFMIGEALGVNAGRNEITAKEYYERVKDRELKACVNGQARDLAICVEQAVEAAQNQSDSRQDLYAQQDMSKWTGWLLVLTVFTFALSAGGLWALLKTIWQGQEALSEAVKSREISERSLDHARSASIDDLRPWLTFEVIKVISTHYKNGVFNINIEILVKNYGRSPGSFLQVKSVFNEEGFMMIRTAFDQGKANLDERFGNHPWEAGFGPFVAPNDEIPIRTTIEIDLKEGYKVRKILACRMGPIPFFINGRIRLFYRWKGVRGYTDQDYTIGLKRTAGDMRFLRHPFTYHATEIAFVRSMYGRAE